MAMIDIDIYKNIRRLYTVDGLSQRQIAKQLNISRITVKKYCNGAMLPGRQNKYKTEKSLLRITIEGEIVKIIESNKDAPSKQKLNAKIVWENLVKTGYTIGESTIRKYIQEMRIKQPDIFIPLEFEPGEAMEVDWGDAYAYINGIKTSVSIFCAVLPYSYGIFIAVFPDKTSSCFFSAHVSAFEYFGGVPSRCIYDNLRSAVLEGSGKHAIKQERFKKLEAHYAFEAIFCNIASGWEKGGVENLVSIARQIAFVPIPKVESFHALQEEITRKCVQYCMTHKIKGRPRGIKEMLEEEKTHLIPLPAHKLDILEEIPARVSHDLTVRLKGIKYSVPPRYVGLCVTLKVFPFDVEIYYKGELVCKHKKAQHSSDHQYIPEHYLEILEKKQRAINNAAPLSSGVLPEELAEFMKIYKQRDRNYQLMQILLLGQKINKETLLWAVKQANSTGTPTYNLICFYLQIQNADTLPKVDEPMKVDLVDLQRYDMLIKEEASAK